MSQIVRTLESKVGGRLFDRTSRRVRLTPLGEQLQAKLAPAYRALEDAFAETRAAATGIAGTLRLGRYTPVSAGRYMVEIASTFERRHPDAHLEIVNTGFSRNYLDALREGEIDMLALRLPVTADDITIGPILSHEQRVLLVSKSDAFAQLRSVCVEDFVDRPVSDVPAFPREMMDTFIPSEAPSGRSLTRVANRDIEELLMRVALGEQVHPTVRLMVEYLGNPGVTAVLIRDLPPSQTALAWLSSNSSPKVEAFARAAADVLAHTDLAPHQPRRKTAKPEQCWRAGRLRRCQVDPEPTLSPPLIFVDAAVGEDDLSRSLVVDCTGQEHFSDADSLAFEQPRRQHPRRMPLPLPGRDDVIADVAARLHKLGSQLVPDDERPKVGISRAIPKNRGGDPPPDLDAAARSDITGEVMLGLGNPVG